jgi:hypothetical protein
LLAAHYHIARAKATIYLSFPGLPAILVISRAGDQRPGPFPQSEACGEGKGPPAEREVIEKTDQPLEITDEKNPYTIQVNLILFI